MIHIDRRRVPPPDSLGKAGAAERERATNLYRDPRNREKPFKFKAYKDKDVIKALNALSHGKCAYCESRYLATAPSDIEHFRPKGAVSIDRGRGKLETRKPGYYWLAADWENLLPSCNYCNRPSTQEFPGDMTATSGKRNQFPLISEARRATRPEEDTLERGQRLLLHPCQDQPEQHLEYTADGLIGERPGRRKGRVTIDVLGLRRKPLKEERRKCLLILAEKMDDLVPLVEQLDANPSNRSAVAELDKRIRRLRRATRADEEYAGMSRQFMRDFEASLKNRTLRKFVYELLVTVTRADSNGELRDE